MPLATPEVPALTVAERLNGSQLRARCDPARLGFATTAELPDMPLVLGQDRAVAAIQFGIGMWRDGYNVFALGPTGAGKHAIVRRFLEEQASQEPSARDWCYVHNFEQPHRPRAISLPRGMGIRFRVDVARLVDELRTAITGALETDEYRQRHQQIHEEFTTRRDQALEDLRVRAAAQNVALIRTPLGLALAPLRDGQVVDSDAFQQLPEAEREKIRTTIQQFEAELESILRDAPKWAFAQPSRITARVRLGGPIVRAAGPRVSRARGGAEEADFRCRLGELRAARGTPARLLRPLHPRRADRARVRRRHSSMVVHLRWPAAAQPHVRAGVVPVLPAARAGCDGLRDRR
jgi:hypothetical protein